VRMLTIVAALAAAACSTFFATSGDLPSLAVHVQPPATYNVPAGAVTVATSRALAAALETPGRTIAVADGTYDSRGAFVVAPGVHVYAEHVGRAVLHSGLSIGQGPALVRGLSFRVRDARRTQDGAAILVWGAAHGTTVDDVSIDGAGALSYALEVRAPDGFVGRRIVARNLTSDGIVVDTYPRHVRLARPPVLADLDVAHVSRPKPRSSNGTAEACIWLGVRVAVTRARARDCAWMGVWTGFNSVGGRYSELDIDDTPVGVYVEHYTTDSVFSHLVIGTHVRNGVNCEWAAPAYGGKPASVRNVFRDSVLESFGTGVFLDQGTRSTSIVNSTFRGQKTAAIVDFRGRGNSYSGNDYSGISPSAVPVSHDHG